VNQVRDSANVQCLDLTLLLLQKLWRNRKSARDSEAGFSPPTRFHAA
jgi:hypothetical protein